MSVLLDLGEEVTCGKICIFELLSSSSKQRTVRSRPWSNGPNPTEGCKVLEAFWKDDPVGQKVQGPIQAFPLWV